MEDIMELGLSLDECGGVGEDRVVWVNSDNVEDYAEVILWELKYQPESYAASCKAEDLLARIEAGKLFAWVYVDKNENCRGIVLFRMSRCDNGALTLTMEFVSCRNFHFIARSIAQIEERLIKAGVTYVDAIAHPTIAQYFAYKHGYAAPGVYIRKAIGRGRNN